MVRALSNDLVEANSPEYPGLAGLAAMLVEDRFLNHRDKEVRLHTVLACMDIFSLVSRVLLLLIASDKSSSLRLS